MNIEEQSKIFDTLKWITDNMYEPGWVDDHFDGAAIIWLVEELNEGLRERG